MVKSPKPSPLAESARAVPASSRTRAANRDLRRILMEGRVIALARRSSGLLHGNMEDAGAVIMLPAGGGIPSLLIERPRLHLRRQRQFRRAASPRFVLEKREECVPDPAAPDVIDDGHPLNPRNSGGNEDHPARPARNPIGERQRMHGLGVEPVQLQARRHPLLLHEHRPADPQALLDVFLASSEPDLDHASFGASQRSVATAQSTAPRTQKSASETRLLVAKPGMRPPTLMELRKFRVGSESCRNARMVPITLAPAIRPEANSTPGPLSASVPLRFRFAVRSAMYRTIPPIMMGVLVDSGR